jgi:uroporphyrinogen decarboxylase
VFLRGYENLMTDLLEEPPQLLRLIDMLLEYNMDYMRRWLDIGVDVVWHHGDIGSQRGPAIAPDTFRKFLKPAYKEMFQACRRSGAHVWYSSDGNLLALVDDLVECGVSIHDPQVRPNTIDGIGQHYRDKLCALVDIDEQMLPFATPEQIDKQVEEIVAKVGAPEGGLMLFAIPSQDVPLENIEALYLAWETHCFYNWPP